MKRRQHHGLPSWMPGGLDVLLSQVLFSGASFLEREEEPGHSAAVENKHFVSPYFCLLTYRQPCIMKI